MKILWVSNNPDAPSAYGKQTKLVVERLWSYGYEVDVFPNYLNRLRKRDGMIVAERPPGYDLLLRVARDEKYDLVIFFGDLWPLAEEYLDVFRELTRYVPLATYGPVDSETIPHKAYVINQLATYNIAMSRHAEHLLNQCGLPTYYIPHCIDTNVFNINRPENRPCEGRLVGMVQSNIGTRKLIALQLEAFTLAKAEMPDLMLYLHTDIAGTENPYAFDYRDVIGYLGIDDSVLVPNDLNADDYEMARLYNSFDLLLHTTAGEGFGVPIIEAMACGITPIVTANSAMTQFRTALQVPPRAREFIGQLLTWQSWPDPAEVAKTILRFFSAKVDPTEELREEALTYDVDAVVHQCWIPFLEQVGKDLSSSASRPFLAK